MINDPTQVANLLSTFAIEERQQYYPEHKEADVVFGPPFPIGAKVIFLLPKGEERKMGFLGDSDRTLADARGGRVILATSAFYQAVSQAVAKAEGRPVSLLGGKIGER
jgi:hypothetical protein